jgi:hypothetical protein
MFSDINAVVGMSLFYNHGRGGGQPPPPSLLGKQSQLGNIHFTVGLGLLYKLAYWLIIKINGTNSVTFWAFAKPKNLWARIVMKEFRNNCRNN